MKRGLEFFKKWTELKYRLVAFSRPHGNWIAVLVIVAVVFGAYLVSLSRQFVPEDAALVNLLLVTEPPADPAQYFGSVSRREEITGTSYRPLVYITLAMDYQVGQLDSFRYHQTNVVLHVLCAVLVYWLALTVTGRRLVAFCAALVFGTHPAVASCVSFVSGRGDVLAAAGVLGSLVLFARSKNWRVMNAILGYVGALAAFAAALFSAEIALVMPMLLLAYLALIERGEGWRRWVRWLWLLPVSAVEVLYLWARKQALGGWGFATEQIGTWKSRVLMSLEALGVSVATWFSPAQVPLERSLAVESQRLALVYLAVGIGSVLLTLAILWRYRRANGARMGVTWLWICWLPLTQLIGHSGLLGENWLYLASVGIWLTAFATAAEFMDRHKHWPIGFNTMALIMVLAVPFLMARTIRRNRDWRIGVGPLAQSLIKTRQTGALHTLYGEALQDSGITGQALIQYQIAVSLDPKNAQAQMQYGWALHMASLTSLPEALEHLREAVRLDPTDARKHSALGFALVRKRLFAEAIASYRESMRIDPKVPDTCRRLAWLLASSPQEELRKGEEALTLAKRAVELYQTENPLYLDTLAAACAEVGDFPDAVRYAARAANLAKEIGQNKFAGEIRRRQKLYMNRRPYRQKA